MFLYNGVLSNKIIYCILTFNVYEHRYALPTEAPPLIEVKLSLKL